MEAVVFPKKPFVTAIQLSRYPQDDGSDLYAVEALNADDTWDILATEKNVTNGWIRAGEEALALGAPLLPESTFPGRA